MAWRHGPGRDTGRASLRRQPAAFLWSNGNGIAAASRRALPRSGSTTCGNSQSVRWLTGGRTSVAVFWRAVFQAISGRSISSWPMNGGTGTSPASRGEAAQSIRGGLELKYANEHSSAPAAPSAPVSPIGAPWPEPKITGNPPSVTNGSTHASADKRSAQLRQTDAQAGLLSLLLLATISTRRPLTMR
jgi:hypothetical protein